MPLDALFELAFAAATPHGLTLRHSVTRRPMMQKVRRRTFPEGHSASTACRRTVSGTISLPSPGCFSPFPHGTCSLSVIKEYLGLGSGLPIFRQNFTCSALLENKTTFYLYGTITHYGLTFQKVLVIIILLLAWSAFARHY